MNENTYNESKCNNIDQISCNSVETETTTNSTNNTSQVNISRNLSNNDNNKKSSNSNIKKFNRYFQTKLTNNERVVDVFSCALQRNDNHLLIHGTLFVTCKYYAFYSNIFGYQTKFEGKWYDVLNIKKENIALVFPTAIKIELNNNQKIVLASFMARNHAFDCILSVWQTAKINKKIKNDSRQQQQQQNYKPSVIQSDNNNNNNNKNETKAIVDKTNKMNEIRKRRNQKNSSLSSSSNSSICFETTENVQSQKMSDTSSLTSSISTNISIQESRKNDNIEVAQLNESSSLIRRNTNTEKDFYKKFNILYRIKFFVNFIITIIINNSLNLKTKVLTISTSITSLTSITTISSDFKKHQIQEQSQIQTGLNSTSFNNLVVIIIFLIILSILYLYVFIILTQINHIEEKLLNLYKKLNF